jgi:hypothetical protein
MDVRDRVEPAAVLAKEAADIVAQSKGFYEEIEALEVRRVR